MTEDPRIRSDEEERLLGRDPEADRAARQRAEEEAELEAVYLRQVMESPIFRAWLMRQLVGFETFGNPYGVSPSGFPDHALTQFRLGMKAAGWHLWTILDSVAPDTASLMRREAVERALPRREEAQVDE